MPQIPNNYKGYVKIQKMGLTHGIYYTSTIKILKNKQIIRGYIECSNDKIYLITNNNMCLEIYYCENDDIYESINGNNDANIYAYLINFIDIVK